MAAVSIANVLTGTLQVYIDSQPANSVTIAWQIPQYIFISLGEIMVAVPGLEFAYSQAPPAMKNIVTALWCLTQAMGSLLDAGLFSLPYVSRARPPVFYGLALLMALFLGMFMWLTSSYEYLETATATLEEIEPPPPPRSKPCPRLGLDPESAPLLASAPAAGLQADSGGAAARARAM